MIRIIAVGKIKESYLTEAITEYSKRLKAYTRLEILQVADEKCPEKSSDAQISQVKEREGARILSLIDEKDYVITLEIQGKKLTSEAFSHHLEMLGVSGHSDIVFVIGGSVGLSPEVSQRSNYKLSFSDMTFPHQLMRVILLEQLYRAFKISRNEPYHK